MNSFTGIEGKRYSITEFTHTPEVEIRFEIGGMDYLINVTIEELRELSVDLSKLAYDLKLEQTKQIIQS